MNRRLVFIGLVVVLPMLLLAAGLDGLYGLALAQGPAPQGEVGTQAVVGIVDTQSVMGAGFTYQGQLVQAGSPVSGTCSFQFGLWDASLGPGQVGVTRTLALSVTGGLFTASLDFTGGAGGVANAFNGEARWLAIRVDCAGAGSYADLGRQALTPAPYALALPGLWTQQNSASPNLIGGYSGNSVGSNVVGAAIGGGGNSDNANQVSGNYGTVGGGVGNQAGVTYATIAGGGYNTVTADGWGAAVSGGYQNLVSAEYAAVGGGVQNHAGGDGATVGGGGWNGTSPGGNQASGMASTIGGGFSNQASGSYAAVGGGQGNQAGTNTHTTVGGGHDNTASGEAATVGGGYSNQANGFASTIAGGGSNVISSTGWAAAIGGGYNNRAAGWTAAVPGGENNMAAGNYSFAAGRRAKANSAGCFVWGDSTDADVTCAITNAFVVRASGGVTIYTNAAMNVGAYLPAGQSAWTTVSDRALKANVVAVDASNVLARLMRVPVSTWNYTSQDAAASIRHMGPMAQDFYAAFGLGEDDKHISTVDADGVALAAIQGLYAQNQALAAENAALKSQAASQQQAIDDLQRQNAAMEARLAALEAAVGGGER